MTTSRAKDSRETRAWSKQRALWATRLPLPCIHCGQPVEPGSRWHLSHPVAKAEGGADVDARPAHATCNLLDGAQVLARKYEAQRASEADERDRMSMQRPHRRFSGPGAASRRCPASNLPPHRVESAPVVATIAQDAEIRPETTESRDERWSSASWLSDLLEVPVGASWPRLMSAPHPRAVGSYGEEVAYAAHMRTGLPLRWWQRLALARILEHDADGELVWGWWLLSTARQVGKSWLLRELFLWRIGQGERFGEPQLVLHTGKDLPVCREVQRPARVWGHTQPGWKVREANGMEEIELPDGSRWIIRGKGSTYGYSASLSAVDEAWKVEPEVVDDGIEPTMAERASSQLGLISTAHRLATSLMPERRAGALNELTSPVDTLLLEWSAHPEVPLDDRVAWRQASPHWSPRRERLVESRYLRALAGKSEDPDEPDPVEAFRSQWLDIWPDRQTPLADERVESLVDDARWRYLTDLEAAPVAPVVIGLEDWYGRGASVACAAMTEDGRVIVWGRAFGQRVDAIEWAAAAAERWTGSRLIVGPTLTRDPGLDVIAASRDVAAPAKTRAGLARIRALAEAGTLVNDGSDDLRSQLVSLRVTRGSAGLAIWGHGPRSDLARACSWVVEDIAGAVALTEEPQVF